jgi:hypothetical protein
MVGSSGSSWSRASGSAVSGILAAVDCRRGVAGSDARDCIVDLRLLVVSLSRPWSESSVTSSSSSLDEMIVVLAAFRFPLALLVFVLGALSEVLGFAAVALDVVVLPADTRVGGLNGNVCPEALGGIVVRCCPNFGCGKKLGRDVKYLLM